MVKKIIVTLIYLVAYYAFANSSTDSLKKAFYSTLESAQKAEFGLNILAEYYRSKKLDSAIVWGGIALDYARLSNDTLKLIRGYRSLGHLCKLIGDYNFASDNFLALKSIYTERKDFKNIALTSQSIASVYYQKEDYLRSRKYYLEALEIFRQIEDKYQQAGTLLNIGLILLKGKDNKAAKFHFKEAIKIYQENRNKKSHNNSIKALMNIGYIYLEEDSLNQALKMFNQAERRVNKERNIELYSDILTNLGLIYIKNGFDEKAKKYLYHSLELGIQSKINKTIVINYLELAKIDLNSSKYKSAEKKLQLIIRNPYFVNKNELKVQGYELLSEINFINGQFDKAYKYLKLFNEAKQAIHHESLVRTILKEKLENDFNEEISIQKKEVELKEQKIRVQNIIGWSLIIGLFLLLVLIIFIYKNYKNQKAAKILISEQKSSLEELHEGQTSSIRYAKKIQDAILPSKDSLSKFLPEHFVFYLPRDIVSGDFYWAYKTKEGHSIFAVADCTGHGVPGAFMSMIGHSLLNEIIISREIINPARVLNNMRSMIISSLHQKGEEGEARDGMDMALCIISPDNKKLNFAGAFNSLYLIRENELTEIKADKQPVGYYSDDQLYFTNREIDLNSNDRLYVFSDGFPDQFGGPKGKKYMYGKFKRFLMQIHQKPMEEQNILLKNEFQSWRGQEPQVDDVCIIGVKV